MASLSSLSPPLSIQVYATALGYIGSILVAWSYGSFVAAEEEKKNASPIPLAELRFILQKIEAPDIDTLTKTEYIVMELVRLGKLSLAEIHVHMTNFTAADTSRTGYLSIDEMVACGMAVMDERYEEREIIYGLAPRSGGLSRLNELATKTGEDLNKTRRSDSLITYDDVHDIDMFNSPERASSKEQIETD